MKWTAILGGFLALILAVWLVSWLAGQGSVPDLPAQSGFDQTGDPVEGANPFEKPTVGPFGKVELPESSFAFGQMALGDKKSHEFLIKNVGEGELKLVKGRSTCKCTLSQLEADSIAPGETAKITLTWEPKESSDEFSQQATIWINDPTLWKGDPATDGGIVLKVSGTVEPALQMVPEGASLGTLKEYEPTTFSFLVLSRIYDDAAPEMAEVKTPYISTETEPIPEEVLKELRAKSGIKVNVTIKPEMDLGDFSEKFQFTTAKVPGSEIPFEFNGRRQGPFSILGPDWHDSTTTIRLGEFKAKDGKKSSISIFSSDKDEPIEFEVVDQDPKEMKVSIAIDTERATAGQVHRVVTVEVPPGLPAARRVYAKGAWVEFKTSHPTIPTMRFRVSYISG